MLKDRLKKLRKEHKISQTELANELIITQRSYSRFETGETFPSEEILNKIANYFNVSTDYLLCRTDLKKYTIQIIKR